MDFLQQRQSWIQAGLIFILAIAQYANTSDHDYAWDDAIVITQNSRVQKGLKNIPELFENIKSEKTENRYGYRPIALLSFATDVQLFGLKPGPSHKVNILFYGLLCALIFYFLSTVFFVKSSPWAVFAVSALFVVHPLHTEVVANIKSRDEILALFFGLSALMFLHKGLVQKKAFYYLLTAAFLVLSFNSKESGITFCGVALLMPFYVSKEKLPNWKTVLFGSGVAVISALILLAIRDYVYSEEFFQTNDWDLIYKGVFLQDGFVGNPLWEASFSEKLATATFIGGYAIWRFVSPYPLLHDYSYNVFSVRTWSDAEVYVSLALLVFLGVLAIHGIWKRKPHGFGIGFFFVTLSIYLHLVHVGPDIFAERYLFVPSLGICIALLSLFQFKFFQSKWIVPLTMLALVPMFVYSFQRNAVWKNNETLLLSDLGRLEKCARANYNYALYLHQEYYQLPASKQAEAQIELLSYYEHALDITDRIFKVYMDLGSAYMEFQRPEQAFEVFTAAAENYPDLSMPFVQLGKYYMAFSSWEQAIPNFQKAIENGSSNSDYYYFKAVCLLKLGKVEEATSALELGYPHGVSAVEYYNLLASLHIQNQSFENAQNILNAGLKEYPNNAGLKQLQQTLNGLNSEKVK